MPLQEVFNNVQVFGAFDVQPRIRRRCHASYRTSILCRAAVSRSSSE